MNRRLTNGSEADPTATAKTLNKREVTKPNGIGISSAWGIHYEILSVHSNNSSSQPPSLEFKKV
jgi:hypothetical protein